jgi:hypothetical protein
MTNILDNPELKEAFEIIISIDSFSDYIVDLAELVYTGNLDKLNIEKVLKEHNIENIKDIKEEILDLLIVYINLILKDHIITDIEKKNIETLKIYLKIKEGDFFKYRPDAIEDCLNRQFELLYGDNKIESNEALYNVGLQDLFDLSYDQFDTYKEKEVRNALERGASIADLDTAKYPKVFLLNNEVAGRSISKQVMIDVWNRDGGKCVKCGSQDKLEYDHIIAFSKGGSNTFRNIQLLCEACNRKKKNSIE